MSVVSAQTIDMIEEVIRGFIKSGATPSEFVIAISNAFCHGDIIAEDYNLGKNDKYLQKFHDGIDKMLAAAEKMEK